MNQSERFDRSAKSIRPSVIAKAQKLVTKKRKLYWLFEDGKAARIGYNGEVRLVTLENYNG